MLDVKKCLNDCEEKMDMSVLHLEETLAQIRAGKANVHILDDIRANSSLSSVLKKQKKQKWLFATLDAMALTN